MRAQFNRQTGGSLEAMQARFELHLATVQEHERAAYLWNQLALKDSFDSMQYAAALGCSKPDHAFYRAVEVAGQIPPAAIFFIDDNMLIHFIKIDLQIN